MRKIFSFMLIAAGLLIGSQVKAVNVANETDLRNAIANAAADATIDIKLTTDITLTQTLVIPADLNSQGHLVVNLDLGEYTLDNGTNNITVINLKHGTLNLSNGQIESNATDKDAVVLNGSINATDSAYSVINVNKDAKIIAHTYNALVVTELASSPVEKKVAYGVIINVYGYIYGHKYGIKVNGVVVGTGKQIPQVNIFAEAEVECATNTPDGEKDGTAVYCSGVANYNLQGYIHGNIGVVVKGGDVVIDGANIVATGTSYTAITAGGSGMNGGSGCGLIVDSQSGYAGGQNVTIKGDTKITGASGYAVQEVIVSGSTAIEQVNFEGGTIVGGTKGAMNFTESSTQGNKVTVYGGQVEGTTTIGANPNDTINSLTGSNTFVSEIQINGSTVFVVSQGTKPAATPVGLLDAAENANIILAAESVKLLTSKALGYVEMPNNTKDTIASGVTLKIDKLVMGDNAQFVVMPGAKLLIMGEQGMVAGKTSNLVIKADATGMGIFAFNPAVTSNRTPKATVEYYAQTHIVTPGDNSNYKWDIMVSPFKTISNLYNDQAGKGYLFAYQYWDGKKWVRYTDKAELISEATAFQPIAIGNNTASDVPTIYTFEGELQGNNSGIMRLERGYNFMGNAYVAPMKSQEIFTEAAKSGKVDASIWIWDFDTQNYKTFTSDDVTDMSKMDALGFFILKASGDVEVNLNYKKLVWDFNTAE